MDKNKDNNIDDINKNLLEFDYKNLVKNQNKNIINFKPDPISKLESEFFIHAHTKSELYIQFKLNYKFMKSVEIVAGEKTYSILESIRDGILLNCKIGINNLIKIILKPLDYCANINIWDVQIFKSFEFVKINWDHTYIINLKRRPDRKELMKEKLKKIGIENYEFVNGVDGQSEKISKEFSKRKKNTRIANSGHFGCILSHVKVIKNAIKNGYKQIMVLEDDIEFNENFMDLIKNIERFKC